MISYHLSSEDEVAVSLSNVKKVIKSIIIYANVCLFVFNVINLISELGCYWLIRCELMFYT